jgi:hypothetical protein
MRSEYDVQKGLFEWAERVQDRHPELKLLNGSLNGVRLSIGAAKKAKRIGMKKGFPDVQLPVPRGGYHGLFIELKPRFRGIALKKKPYPTPEQKEWLEQLAARGYSAHCCRGLDEAIACILNYLHLHKIL